MSAALPANAVQPRDHVASQWLDLAEGRLRLDRLAATAPPKFLPLGVPPIPRETRNVRVCRPSLRYGPPSGCVVDRLRHLIAIEAAVVAGSRHKEK